MCMSAPNIPAPAERQATKLPDGATTTASDGKARARKAWLAGLITSPMGVLGSPNVAKPTLG